MHLWAIWFYFAILLFISASLLHDYTPPLPFVSEVEPDTPTSPNWTAGGADGQDRTGSSSRWHRIRDAAARGGTTKGGCREEEEEEEEEGFWGALRSVQSFYRAVSLARRSLKMNSLILLSLFATVIAGKSPRLKFVVHGRQRCIFWMLSGFTTSHSDSYLCRQSLFYSSIVCVRLWIDGWGGWTDEWMKWEFSQEVMQPVYCFSSSHWPMSPCPFRESCTNRTNRAIFGAAASGLIS